MVLFALDFDKGYFIANVSCGSIENVYPLVNGYSFKIVPVCCHIFVVWGLRTLLTRIDGRASQVRQDEG